jgi:putative DNA methylase
MDQQITDTKSADVPLSSSNDGKGLSPVKRAIEVGFPIAEINRLAVPERYSYKPIYQLHKWFARRASCVFRAILLGVLKPAVGADGTATDLMEDFYKDHSHDPETKDKVVLDPFMGGGTTVVEASRLGCRVRGVDLNPVAWFIVKTETEPADLDALKAAFDRLVERPVPWNGGKSVRETLLRLYKTEIGSSFEADVIYTYWVKSAICTDVNCQREVSLFKDYIVTQKPVKIPYHRDAVCPDCRNVFDWEVKLASLIAEPALMVNAPRGSGGEGRPTTRWSFAPEPPKPRRRRDLWQTDVFCPHCQKLIRMNVPSTRKPRKSVLLSVLLCPQCETVWQWRGPLPDEKIICPSCQHLYDPRVGTVVEESSESSKTVFQCGCGQRDQVIASLRTLPQGQRLSMRPYAIQAYIPTKPSVEDESDGVEPNLFEVSPKTVAFSGSALADRIKINGLLLPSNGRFFKRVSVSDIRRLEEAESVWNRQKNTLSSPRSSIPDGEKTRSGLLSHHYNYWHEMFSDRQLLALSTLLQGIMAEEEQTTKELLLCAFSNALEANNLFTRHRASRSKPGSLTAEGVFARHDFQPKATVAENNVFGLPGIGAGSFLAEFGLVAEGLSFQKESWDWRATDSADSSEKIKIDPVFNGQVELLCKDYTTIEVGVYDAVVTDPPYVGNVNYAELATSFMYGFD